MRVERYTWILLLVLLTALSRSCYEEVVVPEALNGDEAPCLMKLDGVPVFEDVIDRMALFTLPEDSLEAFSPTVEFNSYEGIAFNGINLRHGEVNELGAVRINQAYELIASNGDQIDTFRMMFTTIPLLRILHTKAIPWEPKVESWLQLQYGDKAGNKPSTILFESDAGIEYRGITANKFEKRAYGIELWENKFREDQSVPLLGMAYGEDWILDAMYIDKLRMRNKVSFEIWNSMNTSAPGKSETRTGIRMEYVELFLNQRYQGIYCLGEKMDEKFIDFADSQDEKGGLMYKTYGNNDGSTTFFSYDSEPPGPDIEWDGWEQIFPDKVVSWDPLIDLRKLVTMEEDENFVSGIGTVLDLDNVANFYLFLNLIMGWDNTGKNVFLARYDQDSKFFFIPWDLEATWGRNWMMEDQKPNGIVFNGLYDRLIELNAGAFSDNISVIWSDYRSNVFQRETLTQRFGKQYELLEKNGVIQRENLRWDLDLDLDEEYLYISDWIEKRLEVLDSNF
ncbi:MAG: CotH kinase family protein [Bacteroides sp.]|nr:CotH kinase family protein [Bacteroides sp.]